MTAHPHRGFDLRRSRSCTIEPVTALLYSFAPIARPDAQVLILGSMPGKASLQAQQYYAHPRNAFWSVMSAVLGIAPTLPYLQRLEALQQARIALWDVLQSCTRATSLDSDIDLASAVPNDFLSFFAQHAKIKKVFFNGGAAYQLFMQRVYPQLNAAQRALHYTRLPSTSPANARLNLAAKIEAWKKLNPNNLTN